MEIKELTISEFEEFTKNSPLKNHYQTSEYAIFMSENGYEYDIIGMKDEYGNIKAASIILFQKIGLKNKYGYAPKGFILDYFNQNILNEFTNLLKDYYLKEELIDFCRKNDLQITGGKLELTERITNFLNTGKKTYKTHITKKLKWLIL